MSDSEDSWLKWSKHVLAEIERFNKTILRIEAKLEKMSNDIIVLNVKAGLWGLLGGAIPVLIGLGIWALKG